MKIALLHHLRSERDEVVRFDIFERISSYIYNDSDTGSDDTSRIRGRLRRLNRMLGDVPMSSGTKRVVLEEDEEEEMDSSLIDTKTMRLRFEMFPDVCTVAFVKGLARSSYLILQHTSDFEKHLEFLENLPHGRVVLDAYRLLFEGDEYLAFGLSVTILERALFELHYELCKR